MDGISSSTVAGPSCLFVYGTLRAGSRNSRSELLMPGSRLRGSGRTRGQLIDLGSYPGLVASPDTCHWIRGELYALIDAPAVLARLDRYEGCAPGQHPAPEFERVIVTVDMARSMRVQAWTYVYRGTLSGKPTIRSGDYLHFAKGGR